jgi:sulfite reductase (NADPH) hemoprotein beta-component
VVNNALKVNSVRELIEAVLDVYKDQRDAGENFIDTLQRVGFDPFKSAANAARYATARAAA